VPAVTGKDLLRTFSAGHFRHRCTSTEIAVAAIVAGYRVSTEREIAQGTWLGGEQGIKGKKPDVLIRAGDGAYWWVEVEKSRKNKKDYAALLKWLGVAAQDAFRPAGPVLLGEKARWGKVVFICTAAFRAKLTRDLMASGWKKALIQAFLLFDTCLYRFEEILFS